MNDLDLDKSNAARRDRTIAECNELRQENAELRAKYGQAVGALDNVAMNLEFAAAGFAPGTLARKNADAAVSFARLVLAKAASHG